jgi:hypothetical protein
MAADKIKADSDETAPAGAAPSAKAVDEFDPMGWKLPLICKDCEKPFEVPYRHFQAGVVFHCTHCHGSFVPKMTMYRTVRETFETFYAKRRHDREEFLRTGSDEAMFARKQESELAEFHKKLDEIARAMRPAGKMVRPKGIGAMFT